MRAAMASAVWARVGSTLEVSSVVEVEVEVVVRGTVVRETNVVLDCEEGGAVAFVGEEPEWGRPLEIDVQLRR